MSNDGSKIWKFGKFVAVEFPEVYFRFVSALHREHPDLIHAMQLAQVELANGTALDFLNQILGTSITRETSMELGYAELLDKLNQRSRSIISSQEATELAGAKISETYLGFKRSEEEYGKPLFPSIEEMESKGMKPQ